MKYRFIYHKWWKIVTLLILLYVFIVGFQRPLQPGILSVSKYELVAGESFDVTVQTYNTFSTRPESIISAYIKLDSAHITQVPYVMASERDKLQLRGAIPYSIPDNKQNAATLIIHDTVDGYFLLPQAFLISPSSSISTDQNNATWNDSIGVYEEEWSFRFPFIAILYETIRNTFFHVAIWMAMFILLTVGLIYSIIYLRKTNLMYDAVASSFTHVGVFLGILGIITGSLWGKATWGAYWTDDPKLNMSAVAMMIYIAYSILRASMMDADKRAKVTASYNIFAFIAMIPLIFVIPRMTDGLHPGNGGNPALGGEDLDSTLRLVFYPAIIGYTLLGVWLSSLLFRIRNIELKRINKKLKV